VRTDAYTVAALRRATDAIATAAEGTRARVTYDESYSLGRLIGAGLLDVHPVEAALLDAAQAAGLPNREALNHIRSGLRRGQDRPREVDDREDARPRPPRPATTTTPSTYPPGDEVRTLWRHALPVTEDEEVAAWLEARGLDPVAVELYDLGRALPDGALPSWAACGRSWAATGHRLLLPVYTATGERASLRARAVRDAERKELATWKHAAHGLVLACPMARQLLTHGPPEWWVRSIVIVEGAPDFLTWATRQAEENEDGPAVLGVFSGSWTDELAARIPDGARVAIRTHADPAGDNFAVQIAPGLAGRCDLFRLQPESKTDV